MLNKFKTWVHKEQKKIESWGYKIEITQFPTNTNKPQGYKMDLDSEDYIARITFFDSGKCQLEIINVSSEETIFFEYLQLNQNDKLNNVFINFLDALKK